MRKIALLCVTALVLVGCGDNAPTTAPVSITPTPHLAISDGAHGEDGNGDFFFLPPLVDAPSPDGVFNPRLEPTVKICELKVVDTSPVCANDTESDDGFPAEFTTTSGPGGATVRVSVEDEHYHLNWHTKDAAFVIDTQETYRILVLIDGTVLGYADAKLADNGRELKNLGSDEIIALKDGRTLPIKFRIEKGASPDCDDSPDCTKATIEPSSEPETVLTGSGDAGLLVPSGALEQPVTITIKRLVFAEPEQKCLPTSMEQIGPCYRYEAEPDLSEALDPDFVEQGGKLTAGVCVDLAALEDAYTLHKFDPENPDAGVVKLPNAPAEFLECGETQLSFLQGEGALRAFARAGWNAVVRPIGDLLAPTPLWATDAGLGGLTLSFSRIGWARALRIEPVSETSGSAPAGDTLRRTIKISAEHFDGSHAGEDRPVTGIPVTFTITDGGGILGAPDQQSVTVITSGADTPNNREDDGFASVRWLLGSEAGTNTLEVTAAAAGSPVTFTVEAINELVAPELLSPEANAVIAQNDPSTGCELHATRGYGYQIDFDWTDVASAVSYQVHAQHPTAELPIVDETVETSEFLHISCNSFTDLLDGWEWRVRAQDATGAYSPWSNIRLFNFAPCRLENGERCFAS